MSASSRSSPRSASIRRATAARVPRRTICSSGCRPSWALMARRTPAVFSSSTFTSRTTIRSVRQRHARSCGLMMCASFPLTSTAGQSGRIPHAHLSLQYQLGRRHLPRHSQGQLVARAHHLQGAAVHLLAAHRLQSAYAIARAAIDPPAYFVPLIMP